MSSNKLIRVITIIGAVAVSWFNLNAVALYVPDTTGSTTGASTFDPDSHIIPPAQSVAPFFYHNDDLPANLRSYIDASNYHLIRQNLPNPATYNAPATLTRRNLSNPDFHSVMSSPNGVNLYVVFFGTGLPTSLNQTMASFFNNVPNNHWFDTLIQYYGTSTSAIIRPRLNYVKSIVDPSTQSSVYKNWLEGYLNNAIDNFGGVDPDGIYIFMAGSSVTACPSGEVGYHSAFYKESRYVPYIFVSPKSATSNTPVITLAHELAETLTDPTVKSWMASDGSEVADLCERLAAGHITNIPGAPYYDHSVPKLFSNMDNGCVLKPSSTYGVCTSSCPADSSIYHNDYITPGTSIFSPDGKHVLQFQLNGDIVEYKITDTKKWVNVWSTGTAGYTPFSLTMQGDGNLVGFLNGTVWTTNTYHAGSGPYCFTVQNNGNLAIFDSTCTATYSRFSN